MSRFVGSVAVSLLLLLPACQQADSRADEPTAAQLPARDPGAHTVLTAPLSVAGGIDAIVQDAVFAPEAELPRHYHPGEEVLYMIEGSVELFEQDKPAITLVAGEAHAIPAGLAHHARAGRQGARAVIFRAHPQGEEIRFLVDEAKGDTQ